MDFEVGVWEALRSVLLEVETRECVFHSTKADWRKVRKD